MISWNNDQQLILKLQELKSSCLNQAVQTKLMIVKPKENH